MQSGRRLPLRQALRSTVRFQGRGRGAAGRHVPGKIYLVDEMGLGKMITSLCIMAYYESKWPLLILRTVSLKYQWPDEIEKFGSGSRERITSEI